MKTLMRFKWFLWYFGHFKIPLIGYVRPQIVQLDDEMVVIKIPLARRSKNHWQSMYFGALAIGADLAGGLFSIYYAKRLRLNAKPIFKSLQANFLQRANTDVFFVCAMGREIHGMLQECQIKPERINKMIAINAYTNYPTNPVLVAIFELELSLKV